ncbi:Vanillate O-demethylase oxidoreductase [Pseudonocardia sp. Ae168_Ps1]|uniref:PDR/VanB family oxidoreductase n=1 Tax=unclassified Pseudonocardia TaxID=2619320 RepID=UPI00094ACAC9|nr:MULTISPECIES: PDR/VanB family oxidoreductase [unclassified Pseudonocardia]OLL73031.1 Vanillate O-demethylase oxidoreductase [Pseudonocardia sp. Ae150A_Ps1]OLL79006.1 Vanillate O-demethylase oxidoreductase [Pseudonocardia sp. Ae168_Ps1]OLL86856.1 Vanillate O-demethylase oxidoreductase [Pseudonocardia sp. Ae263_Ps1]OLL93100.1 Vanillate O-demethylase oxidoreductase [Pseudonocardia sp. Ae356_Ps1]
MSVAPPPYPNRAATTLSAVTTLAQRLSARGARRRRPSDPVDRTLLVEVRSVHRPCPDVASLELVPAGPAPLPGWRPGAHVDVELPSGRLRQYSLCGDPADRSVYRIAVRAVPGGTGSAEVHGLVPGTRLRLHGPRNAFPLAAAPGYLFLAGGIGITPIAPMVRAVHAAGLPWRLVHTGRDLGSMPLSAELAALDPRRVVRRPDDDRGAPGADELLSAGTADDVTAVYCCGPPAMIETVRRALPAVRRFHSERFSPPPIRDGRPFTVQVAGGPEIAVPADRTALDAVREVRPDVPYSCRQGFCGTCHVPLLAGTTTGDPAGPGRTALCVGRAEGDRVVVDLGR